MCQSLQSTTNLFFPGMLAPVITSPMKRMNMWVLRTAGLPSHQCMYLQPQNQNHLCGISPKVQILFSSLDKYAWEYRKHWFLDPYQSSMLP